MKNMTQATENLNAPPPGRFLSTIIAATAETSKSGNSMLHLIVAISDGGKYDGMQAHDYLITDGTAKGAGLAKKKMRGLDTNLIRQAIDTDMEIPDSAIAQELVGLQLFVDYGNEPMNSKDANGEYTVPMTTTDEQGRVVPLNKLTVKGYSRSGGVAQAPVAQQVAPAQFVPQQPQFQQPQAPAGFQPQQFAPQQALPQQPQFAQPQQAFAQPGFPQQALPQQPWAGQPQQAFPQAAVPQQFAGQVAQPVWNGGAPAAAPEAPKKGKKGAAAEG